MIDRAKVCIVPGTCISSLGVNRVNTMGRWVHKQQMLRKCTCYGLSTSIIHIDKTF